MCRLMFLIIVLVLLNNEIFAEENVSRQKRCIVIQKQSSGTSDAAEGDDEDYDFKKPPPKDLKPDRLQKAMEKQIDVETISPPLLKYKRLGNKAMYRRLRTKNRFANNFEM